MEDVFLLSLLREVVDRLVNSVAAVSIIKFIFLVFKKIVLNLGADLYNFSRKYIRETIAKFSS